MNGGDNVEHIVLWWSQHRGNAQHTFRTWKLSPAAPMVLQPIGCGRVGHRHNTPTEAARDLYSLWPLLCLAECYLCALNAVFADVALHGAGYAHKPEAPQAWRAASLGRQTNTAVRSTRLTTQPAPALVTHTNTTTAPMRPSDAPPRDSAHQNSPRARLGRVGPATRRCGA